MTFTHALATNNYGPAKFIVDANAANGTHTTIAAALTSASSGDTIAIRPGTYTENLTLKAGVNLVAYGPSAVNLAGPFTTIPNVIISGTCTFTAAGTVGISGISLQTNSAACLAITGSADSVVYLDKCYINCTNTTGISYTTSGTGSRVTLTDCGGDIGTTGIALFTYSGAGQLRFVKSLFTNSGASTTNNTVSGGGFFGPNYSGWANGITLSSSSNMTGDFLDLSMQGNQTAITISGTATFNLQHCTISSNTSTAITIGTGTTGQLHYCLVSSSNGTTIGGTGTLQFTNLTFNSVASLAAGLTLSNSAMNSFISGAGVGTSGQVLTSNGVTSPPTFQTASTGGLTKIASATASNQATVTFTQASITSFANLLFILDNVTPITNAVSLELQYSTNGGSSYVATGYVSTCVSIVGGTTATTTTHIKLSLSDAFANNTSSGLGCFQYIYNRGSTTGSTSNGNSIYTQGTSTNIVGASNNLSLLGNSAAINAFQFLISSGNINTGTFTLYGFN